MAMTPAEKQKAYRERKAANTVTLPKDEYELLCAALDRLAEAVQAAAKTGLESATSVKHSDRTEMLLSLADWFGRIGSEALPAPAAVEIMAAGMSRHERKPGEWTWASEYTVRGIYSLGEYLEHLRRQGTSADPVLELRDKCPRRYGDPLREPVGIPIRTKSIHGESMVIVWSAKKRKR